MVDKRDKNSKDLIKNFASNINKISDQAEIDKFIALGRNSSTSDIQAFVDKTQKLDKIRARGKSGRLMFSMDATASRELSWDQACHIQSEMFHEAMSIGSLEVQLTYYRGYGEFRATPWMDNSEALLRSMLRVHCLGGKTQVDKVLNQAITETQKNRIQALVFIGDAFEEDIDTVSQSAGKLGVLGVPMFCFQEGNDPLARIGFQQMAKLTNGAYCSFDSKSADQLKELLKAVAIFAVGGFDELEKYSKTNQGEALKLSYQIKK